MRSLNTLRSALPKGGVSNPRGQILTDKWFEVCGVTSDSFVLRTRITWMLLEIKEWNDCALSKWGHKMGKRGEEMSCSGPQTLKKSIKT